MDFKSREDVCPVCGNKGRVTRKWVTNSYGKRYDYYIYHHPNNVHYSNQAAKESKRFRKGQLDRILIEIVNSQEYKLGSFRISDIRKLLVENYPDAGFGSIKVCLNRLAQVGIVEKRRKGRNLIFVNTVSKERLSFIIDSISIFLEDKNSNGLFEVHSFEYKIRNDHSWPLYYFPFRAVGDVDKKFEDIDLHAQDSTSGKTINVMLIDDSPSDKRVLLKFQSPLLPEERRDLKIDYRWPEPKQVFVYSSATRMNSFEFSISGDMPMKLSVSLTRPSRNDTLDLSNEVTESSSERWKIVSKIHLENVEPFSVLQLRWKQS